MKKALFTLSFLAVFLVMATGTWATNGDEVKWSQPPDMETGVNIKSIEGPSQPIVADDWKCQDPRPVTDVHFWGSYIKWLTMNPYPQFPTPGVKGFVIRIYKDIPADPPNVPYSHPGELLYEMEIIDDFVEKYVASIEHSDGYEHKFYYSLDLPKPFFQEEGTIYWISIAAIMPDESEFPWGWETSDINWNDNACFYDFIEQMWVEITPDMLPDWYPHIRVNMAFELTVPQLPPPPPPLEPVKWQQRPDMKQGVNIISMPMMPAQKSAVVPLTVADDWFCLDGSPVSDLHFWGSYPGWREQNQEPPTTRPPGVEKFRIQIYSDSPVGTTQEFSRPDKLLYEVWVDDFDETYVASIWQPWWNKYEHKYRYDLDLPRIFWQKRGKIYWLNISAVPKNLEYAWGWESSMDRWNDFAVQGWYKDPENRWWDVIKHPWTEKPIDMSFVLTTCKGPIKWLQLPDMADGFNIASLPMDPVIADDFLCTNGKPVKDVHFWGSYLDNPYEPGEHWQQGNPGPPFSPLPKPPGVQKFKLSFHKDIPAGVDPSMPWSHPGALIKDIWVEFDKVNERYWDSVPHTGPDGSIWWEHKFYYIVHLEELFPQEKGRVYWLDIGAVPKEPGTEPTWFWGWETSKDHWNDNAVRGWEEGWWWENLGELYGSPIDMAFLLITRDDTRYCKGDFDRDGNVDGSDLAILAADFGRTDCYNTGDCEGDVGYDGDVDGSDLAVFAADFGRTDCPCALPVNAH